MTIPDSTGECYQSNISVEMALATGLMKNLVMTLKDPSADAGFYGVFQVPQNYVGTPKVTVSFVLDGTVGATNIGFLMNVLPRADGETIEAAWEESLTFTKQSNDDANEDMVIVTASFASATFVAGEEVFYYFVRDFSADAFVGDIHVTGLFFEYSDA
jgi:hypothetical protein